MPKAVTAYACSFDCRRRVTTSKKSMANHEKTCANNPARRACKICKHKQQVVLPGDLPASGSTEPICAIQALGYGQLMRFDCPQWEPK